MRARRLLPLLLACLLAAPPAHAAPAFLYDLQVAGDLNGDGRADLIGWVSDPSPSPVFTGAMPSLTMQALSGATGATLWTVQAAAHYAVMTPGKVGPTGTAGFFAHLIRAYPDNNGDVEYREEHLRAYRGDGTLLWDHETTVADAIVEGGWRVSFETGDLLPGPATDQLLVATDDGGLDENLGADPDGSTVGASSGATGADGPRVADTGFTGTLPDLSGDGLREIAFVSSDGNRVTVQIRRATDMGIHWTRSFDVDGSGGAMTAVGDVDGDGIVDLIHPGQPATLLSGDDGETLWQRDIGWPHALGDVDDDGLADVGGSYRFSEGGYRHVAVNAAGDLLYSREHTVDMEGATFAMGIDEDAGDVDADGIRDRLQVLYAMANGEVADHRSGIVSGATGEFLWDLGAIELHQRPKRAGGSLDGSGDDLLDARCVSGSTVARALDGTDGSSIWQRTLSGCRFLDEQGDVTGDGKTDLILQEPLTVLDGASGALLWSAA